MTGNRLQRPTWRSALYRSSSWPMYEAPSAASWTKRWKRCPKFLITGSVDTRSTQALQLRRTLSTYIPRKGLALLRVRASFPRLLRPANNTPNPTQCQPGAHGAVGYQGRPEGSHFPWVHLPTQPTRGSKGYPQAAGPT